jgi:MFS family permease
MTDIAFRRGPLAVLLTGTFLIVLDFFIVNVALPSVQRDLRADSTTLEWLVAGYGLTFGGLLLVTSRAADRWGRRRMFTAGVALFVASSAACGLAPDAATLLAARLVQGAAAAAIGPTVLALIGDVYAGPHRVRALGAYATVMGVAAASGQLIGGVLIDLDIAGSGWRAIFLVNVPIGLAALVAAPRLLPDTRVPTTPRVDLLEALLVVGAVTALVLPLIEGQHRGWPLWTWASLVGAALLADLAWLRGRALRNRGIRPMVDPDALRTRPVRAGLAGQALLFIGMASYFLVLALYLQDGRGLGPLASGLVFTIVAGSYLVGTRRAAALIARHGARGTIAVAATTFGLGHLLLLGALELVGTGGSVLWLVPGLAVGGLGMGVTLAGLIGTVMGSVPTEHAGTVSGTASTVQQVGNALGVALVGIVFFGRVGDGMVEAFGAGLVFLTATTVAVAVAAAFLPGRTRAPQSENVESSVSAAV